MYLTFDDGPIPDVTPWVIDVLDKFDAKASFFCVGENVSKYPDIFHKLQAAGHTIGNHTYNHLSGWATDNASYLKNVRKGALITGSKLFRPPYGRIKPSQMKFIKSHYQVVMWDVLSGDKEPGRMEAQEVSMVQVSGQDGEIPGVGISCERSLS